jgi:hypothetical protein
MKLNQVPEVLVEEQIIVKENKETDMEPSSDEDSDNELVESVNINEMGPTYASTPQKVFPNKRCHWVNPKKN